MPNSYTSPHPTDTPAIAGPRYSTVLPSPLGPLTLLWDDEHLYRLMLPEQQNDQPCQCQRLDRHPLLRQTKHWLQDYFNGLAPDPTPLPLAPQGTPFQSLTWQALRTLPYGASITYGDLARQMAASLKRPHLSPQAIGTAVGRNPLPIFIPCHRVLAAGHHLGGYSGGLEAKRFLLKLEHISFIPPPSPYDMP